MSVGAKVGVSVGAKVRVSVGRGGTVGKRISVGVAVSSGSNLSHSPLHLLTPINKVP